MIEGLNDISRYILGARRLRVLGILSSVALLIISLMTIVPACNVSDNTEALSLTAGSTLTFTSNSAVAMVDFSVTDSDGTFVYSNQNQQINFDISTDNLSGYTLRIKSNGNNTSLTDGSHNITSISSTLTRAAFQVGTSYNNKWGYNPSYYHSGANSLSYYPAPSTTGDVLNVTSAANTSADNYTIGIGVRANYASPAGTYTFANNGYNNTTDGNPAMFILEYVANPVDYIINYIDDVNHNASLPSPTYGTTSSHEFQNCSWNGREQHCESELEEATLSSTIPGSPGRTFVGWCTEVTTLDGTVCSGTTYPAGSQFSIDQTQSSITLHAIWQLDTYAVEVDVIGSGLMLLEFINTDYGSETVGSNGGTVYLKYGVTYTFDVHKKKSGAFVSWSTTTNGTLGSTSVENTTYSVTGAATLTLKVKTSRLLYDEVAVQTKGTQTDADLKVDISADNSGVFEYDGSIFGASSDASNDYAIYYYRGILDSNLGSSGYGAGGDGLIWPNYVKLANGTCWRIFRTTGSGGVKMIYNGLYSSGTPANSCANTSSGGVFVGTGTAYGAQDGSSQSDWYKNVNRIGYTYNPNVDDSTTSTSVDTVFGSNSNPSLNSARSNVKIYLEDTWYANNMTAYTSILEASAGYCNDRSLYRKSTNTTYYSQSSIVPYGGSTAYYFGPYVRLQSNKTNSKISLSCPRNTVDLYRYVPNSTGVSNELKYPVALITADESVLAGSGSGGQKYNYSGQIFTTAVGIANWSLSPDYVPTSSTGVVTPYLTPTYNGFLSSNITYGTSSPYPRIRPVISLEYGTAATSGSGTATDPWVVAAP